MATARGKLLLRLADLIARDAEKLAAIEVRDNGKLLAEMSGQVRYIPEWFTISEAWRTRSRAASCRPTSRTCSPIPSVSRWASSWRSRRGTRPCCF